MYYVIFLVVLVLSITISACTTGNAQLNTDTTSSSQSTVLKNPTAEAQVVETTSTKVATPEFSEDEIMETPEVVDIENPLPANNDFYYVAPAYATIEEGVNVDETTEGHHWIVATVSLGNNSDSAISINKEDINLVGENGWRYPARDMIDRVAPTLAGSTLEKNESIYGFALFLLPEEVEPSLFEWCPAGACNEKPLQASISLNES